MYLHTAKLDLGDLERIAAAVDVRLYNEREEGHDRQGRRKYGLVLRTLYERPQARWRRFSRPFGNPPGKRKDGTRTVPGAVCWHGHYAFMEAVFDADPEAKITTNLLAGRIVYDGREGFHENAHRTAAVEVGRGMTFIETCECVKPAAPNENGAGDASAAIMDAFLGRVREEFQPA